jgi:hypothetical protein
VYDDYDMGYDDYLPHECEPFGDAMEWEAEQCFQDSILEREALEAEFIAEISPPAFVSFAANPCSLALIG